ncbi:MAG TPA: ABC transporter permease [Edaphobacter sp.]|jgi:putative ABC transport system permease protein|nr:ABC transporter permease [Edaphobacter sp.]
MQIADTKETVTMALDTLRANKLRSGLTILGIVIGVMTVIVISSVINGLNSSVAGLVESLGTNVMWVFRFPVIGVRPTTEMLTRKQMTYDDAMAMKDLPHVVAVTPGLQYRDNSGVEGTVAVKYGTKKMEGTLLEGDTAGVKDVYDLDMKDGRFFTDADTERSANVVVLGNDTADNLFGTESPVGKDVTIAGMVFTVVGVMEKQKQAFGGGKNPEDNKAFFPVTTFHKIHPEVLDYWISLKYDDQKNKALVQDELTELLRRRRKVPNAAPDNFAIFGTDSLTRLWDNITSGLFLLLFALSTVALLVGGVGVMNIMLVSVTERTREIGVRKAIGASKQTILVQFTLEAITLCAVGGVIGLFIGSAIAVGVGFLFPSALSALWVTVAFMSSCAIGLIFGIYPAWKAANLNPIDALRYE